MSFLAVRIASFWGFVILGLRPEDDAHADLPTFTLVLRQAQDEGENQDGGENMHRASCLCGQISITVAGPLREVIYCHCTQCRRQTDHFVAATAAQDSDMSIDGAEHITWYAASPGARRGFCATCGSNLFWKAAGSTSTSIWAGAFDKPTGLAASRHIFVADKGDYYTIDDGLPQFAQGG